MVAVCLIKGEWGVVAVLVVKVVADEKGESWSSEMVVVVVLIGVVADEKV